MSAGPRTLFGQTYLWLTADDLTQFVRIALSGRAHVHIDPKLLSNPKAGFRECSWGPAWDRSVVGSCLAGVGADELVH